MPLPKGLSPLLDGLFFRFKPLLISSFLGYTLIASRGEAATSRSGPYLLVFSDWATVMSARYDS